MDITKKIIFGGIFIIFLAILFNIAFSASVSEEVKAMEIKRSEKINAEHISLLADESLLNEDFIEGNYDLKKSTFENYFLHVHNDDVIRIKVWSTDGTIIYSDNDTIVGQNFADNSRFQMAIDGKVTTEIKEPVDPENILEIGYGQLMEVYVPIFLDNSDPVGVIELYISLDSTN